MLESMESPSEDVIAFEVMGVLTQEDYIKKIEPAFNEVVKRGQKVRLLLHFGPQFEGFTAKAAWEDFKVGFHHKNHFEKCAVVSDKAWIKGVTTFFSSLMPFPLRVFPDSELSSAKAWLDSGVMGLNYTLDKEKGVLEWEISSPLSSECFEKLSLVVNPYIETHGSLKGLVIHFKDFPRWENLGSLIHHIQFVKGHHKKIQRVALTADSLFSKLAPLLANYFVKAEIKQFSYKEKAIAKQWASQ